MTEEKELDLFELEVKKFFLSALTRGYSSILTFILDFAKSDSMDNNLEIIRGIKNEKDEKKAEPTDGKAIIHRKNSNYYFKIYISFKDTPNEFKQAKLVCNKLPYLTVEVFENEKDAFDIKKAPKEIVNFGSEIKDWEDFIQYCNNKSNLNALRSIFNSSNFKKVEWYKDSFLDNLMSKIASEFCANILNRKVSVSTIETSNQEKEPSKSTKTKKTKKSKKE